MGGQKYLRENLSCNALVVAAWLCAGGLELRQTKHLSEQHGQREHEHREQQQ